MLAHWLSDLTGNGEEISRLGTSHRTEAGGKVRLISFYLKKTNHSHFESSKRLQDSGNDSQYIDAVTLLVQHNLLTMLDCKTSLRSLLYNMDYRSVESAKRLYSGISPVLRSSPDLRDTAFLILRKLMHSCSEDARQVAVVGLLQILKNFRYYSLVQGLSSSQCSMSSQATVDLHHNNSAAAVNRLSIKINCLYFFIF